MKTLITALTLTTLIAGVTAANAADQQATGAQLDNALNHRVAVPSAYASVGSPISHAKVTGTGYDFQLQGR